MVYNKRTIYLISLTLNRRFYYAFSFFKTIKCHNNIFVNRNVLDKTKISNDLASVYVFQGYLLHLFSNYNIRKFVMRHFYRIRHLINFNESLWLKEFFPISVNSCIEHIAFCNDYKEEDKNDQLCRKVEIDWLKGDFYLSFNRLTNLFESGDQLLNKKLIKVVQQLICHSIEKHGVAVLLKILHYVKQFSTQTNEYSIMMTLWYALFTSHLFEDNVLSATLLDDQGFIKYLEFHIPDIGSRFLKNHEVGLYQRLIETSLRYKMDNTAGILLRRMFDYYYHSGYIQGCTSVYTCCVDLDVKLRRDQIYKLSALIKTDLKGKIKCLELTSPNNIIYKF